MGQTEAKEVAIVTGAGGLVGSETVRLLCEEGFRVYGIENDMRAIFFGPEGSTAHVVERLAGEFKRQFRPLHGDIRDATRMSDIFKLAKEASLVVHTAAQPSHDWAASNPRVDFEVNAVGTLNLLEATRTLLSHPKPTFVHISTSKVYGDQPNNLPLLSKGDRFDLPDYHVFYYGITVSMSIDRCLHSLFGVSKASGDLLVQEYGRYFELPTVCFRPGCVTGPDHAGVELHGFLAYLMKCCATGRPYTIFGYNGKQVRCNIYARDLAKAGLAYHRALTSIPGSVFNIGGGRASACSMLEAVRMCEEITGRALDLRMGRVRIGDHRWWISDIEEFQASYPDWSPSVNAQELLQAIYDQNKRDWRS